MKLLLFFFFYQCKLQLWVENPRQQMTLEHAMSQMDPQNSKFFPLYILFNLSESLKQIRDYYTKWPSCQRWHVAFSDYTQDHKLFS